MTLPKTGFALPDFDLPVALPPEQSTAPQSSTLSNADLAGAPFVLFVYPKDATSGCTVEACNFRDLHHEFRELGVTILGLSRDNVRSHARFIEAQNLPYPLLADKDQTVIRDWDLLQDATMYGKPVTKVRRTTFLVDAKGIVRQVFENVQPLGHAQEVLLAARALMPQ